MRLSFICSVCKKQNYLDKKYISRPEMEKSIGSDEVVVNCNDCGKTDKKHINRIDAVVDSRLILGTLLSIVLIYYFGLIATFVLSIPIIIWKYDNENAHRFNSYIINRRK